MEAARWQRIKTIVHTAFPMEPTERESYIADACEDDDRLRNEIEELLRSVSESEEVGFMVRPVVESGRFASDLTERWRTLSSREELIGEHIGAFRITELLGTGGMGSVFKGERIDGGFHQHVAIKLIRKGIDTEENIHRFRLEQEILARLHHPNIAQLHDGGLAGDSTPYVVMEFVDGKPIDEYCNEHRLTVNERIELFKDVCLAVQYAHSNLVIHRDLKTGNIYVTPDGVVKILDFGVAKLLNPTFTDITLLETQPGQKLWTPHYASPEQVRGESITTATDVYALGVLLYKLLTDTYPLDLKGKDLAEIERIITRSSPLPPSGSLSEDDLNDCASRREISPADLVKSLSGDLDALVLAALRKEPEYRYRSVEQLLDDIERYQKRLPLIARKGTTRYRIAKFVRRNKLMLAAASLFLFTVGSFGIYHVYQMAEQRDIAQLESIKARQVSTFLTEMLEAADPADARGETVTARELLDRGTRRIEKLADQPEIQAAMMEVMGRAYLSLGLYDEAEPLLEEAVSLQRDKAEPTDLAEALNQLGRLRFSQRRLREADSLYLDALEMLQQVHGSEHPAVATSMLNLSGLRVVQGELERAEELAQTALEIWDRLPEDRHREIAEAHTGLGKVYQHQGDLKAAGEQFEMAVEQQRLLLSPNLDLATSLNLLGQIRHNEGRYDEAGKLYNETHDILVRLLGPDHPHTTSAYNDLATLLYSRGNLDEAAEIFREVLAARRRTLDENHPLLGHTLTNLAGVLRKMGRLEEAEEGLLQALKIRRNAYGENHYQVALTLWHIGHLRRNQDRLEEAEKVFLQALEIYQGVLPDSNYYVGRIHVDIGTALLEQERPVAAEPYLLEGLNILRVARGEEHIRTREAKERLEAAREAMGTLTVKAQPDNH